MDKTYLPENVSIAVVLVPSPNLKNPCTLALCDSWVQTAAFVDDDQIKLHFDSLSQKLLQSPLGDCRRDRLLAPNDRRT